MNLLQKPLSLLEINDLLEEELKNVESTYRIIGDLDLTYEEYCFISLKSKGIQYYINSFELLEKYRVALIVTWIFTLRYASIDKIQLDTVKDIYNNLAQHVLRKTLDTMAETFEELGINTFGLDIYTIDGLFALIGLHAGIPDSTYNKMFSILDESTNYKDMNSVEHQLFYKMDPRMEQINLYLGNTIARKQFHEIRDIFMDCKINNMSLEELSEKYPNTSIHYIENCIHWCRENALYQEIDHMQIVSK